MTLVVPAGAIDREVTVEASVTPWFGELPEGVAGGPVVDVELDAEPAEPVTLVFEARGISADDVVVGFHDHDGEVAYPEAVLDPAAATVSITAEELSLFSFLKISGAGVRDQLKKVLDAYFGGVGGPAAPDCSGEEEARSEGWTVSSDDHDLVQWCFGIRDGARVLTVVNTRRYPLIVDAPSGAEVVDRGETGFAERVLARTLPVDRTMLSAGGMATWRVDVPEGGSAEFRTEFDGFAQALASVDVSAQWLATFMSKLPGSKHPGKQALLTVMDSSGCLGSLLDNADATSSFDAGDVTKLVAGCLSPEVIAKWTGGFAATVLAAPVALVFGTGDYFVGAWQSLTNLLSGADRYRVTIARSIPPPPTTVDPQLRSFGDVTELVDAFVFAWIKGDQATLATLPISDRVLSSLPAPPANAFMVDCAGVEAYGTCTVQFFENHDTHTATLGWFDIDVVLGDVSGWNVVGLTQTL